jgi:hemin uptake protein HemP
MLTPLVPHPISTIDLPTPSAHPAPCEADALATPMSSSSLLKGRKTVGIAHNGMLYTLQATKLGKLILTK